jgi:catechol 2,3-dioxygenase-like lactoylglutathione lyase family enzyme
MTSETGGPPKSGWAKLVPELLVNDVAASVGFWRDVLGFAVAYERREDRFAYLERPEGAQVMLCQRNGRWETGSMERPLGRGVMFQVYVDDLSTVLDAIVAAKWPTREGPREVWRRVAANEVGQREVFVLDPDGYLVMVAQGLGERPSIEQRTT